MLAEAKFGFPAAYDVQLLDEFPATGEGRVLYVPPPGTRGGRDGMPVRITPDNGAPWIGIFAFATTDGSGYRQIASCPHPDQLCVVAGGAAYVVNVRETSTWWEVTPLYVGDVRQVVDRRILLFADSVSLLAWGENGLLWKTTPLAMDRVAIDEVGRDFVSGRGWDASIPGYIQYRVRLDDGLVVDGVKRWFA